MRAEVLRLARAFSPSSVAQASSSKHRLRPVSHAFCGNLFVATHLLMKDHSHIYIGSAFVAGVVLSIAFKDLFYPEIEERIREYRESRRSQPSKPSQDTATEPLVARHGPPAIVEGIEGCIGNTPLLRIKSLSDATGCEILAKAEVRHGLTDISIPGYPFEIFI